ncbi:MAG: multicopper oxidase domain-containing protein [Anaerolineae bacterium]|nr:multicopper oxidase domain-containing protein [Anaerolineae bacterium]
MRFEMNRRRFLQLLGASAAGFLVTPWAQRQIAAATTTPPSPIRFTFDPTDPEVCIVPPPRKLTGDPDLELTLNAITDQVSILPGQVTQVFRYTGQLIQGNPHQVQAIPGSFLGPIIRARTGERVRIHFSNQLPQQTITHWHGLHVPETDDGHPRFGINPGGSYSYDFEIINRAGMYWFHPHPHMLTGEQVYRGMAGLFIVSDAEEDAANLPAGPFDLPLVIQDRTFDANNQMVYTMMGLLGFLGNTILVNGQPNASKVVFQQPYRLRLLNGSNSRIYKFGWSDGTPLTVIATDGGLLAAPVQRDYVTLSPAERAEILVDFNQWPEGTEILLKSLPFTGATPPVGSLPNGAEFTVMSFHVAAAQNTYLPLMTRSGSPAQASGIPLSPFQRLEPTQARNSGSPRPYVLYANGANWTINGRQFEMNGVASDEIFQLGTQELLEFINIPPGGPGSTIEIAHPMHLHGPHFQVISRTPPTDPTQYTNWLTVKDGYLDEGWKDTVLLMPGERVQIQIAFDHYPGLFLYHCHNLEHEDMGMMRNYRVDA